ncbi:permease-like cell division protein FtsX [Actinoplanes bogorensis]|uniref:Permease-like cell division protein FtsX n=1 Tax=Paractinoplanes bogorensis TaxID=1610840 RepID=A0ABS5Z1W5_9ACTN|nr:permease-like cell division protein FtsX [Actinoplanes bogorensis]MBU2669647.1 permease-like cell division protein FtsX [Actinoplanes bogorensis]
MRRLVTALLALALVPALAACGLFGESDQERLDRLIAKDPKFTVFVKNAVTEQQKTGIEKYLHTVPHVLNVEFETREQALNRLKEMYAAKPDEMPDITADVLPESYVVYVPDADALRAARDSPQAAGIKDLPGVQDVVFGCLQASECQEQLDQMDK